ncbi:hypothetical protein [Lebetimonas sp. JH292]|nr:hypothetical protein [Lebetimonas sp. JH292]
MNSELPSAKKISLGKWKMSENEQSELRSPGRLKNGHGGKVENL